MFVRPFVCPFVRVTEPNNLAPDGLVFENSFVGDFYIRMSRILRTVNKGEKNFYLRPE